MLTQPIFDTIRHIGALLYISKFAAAIVTYVLSESERTKHFKALAAQYLLFDRSGIKCINQDGYIIMRYCL